MAGNFCGGVNFPTHEINAYESMMMGVATNIVAARPTLPSISKQLTVAIVQFVHGLVTKFKTKFEGFTDFPRKLPTW